MTLDELKEGKFFLVDKPLDWTSFDAVNKIKHNIRHAFDIKKIKIGHAGTLDPKATGLLIICAGRFTKKIEKFQGMPKTYTGTIKLGAITESFDTEKPEIEHFDIRHITPDLIYQAANHFTGTIQQYPPIHSAIKLKGKKLYEFARAGQAVETKPRVVQIHRFEIKKIEMPFVQFLVECSKGTYIRSLAHDFGKHLNSGGYLTELRRTAIGEYQVDNADPRWLDKNYWLDLAERLDEEN